MASTLNLDECTADFDISPHDEYPRVLENIFISVHHPSLHPGPDNVHASSQIDFDDELDEPEDTSLATLRAIRITRSAARGDFLRIMDQDSDELHQFSVQLFDKNGQARSWLVDGSKGSRCWGKELNHGELIYVIDVQVDPDYRGQGIGSWVLKKLAESWHVRQQDFIMCWPTPTGVRDETQWAALRARQIGFFRKNGYRRIAYTGFFGYSTSPTHPSHAIAAADDFDPPVFPTEPRLSPEEREQRFPLHAAITNIKFPNIDHAIRQAYTLNPTSISRADENGFTPIWVAAASGNMEAVRTLLSLFAATHSLPDVHPDLVSINNAEYITPLENVVANMRSGHEMEETLLGTWGGYKSNDLKLELMLKRAMGYGIPEATEEEYLVQRRWGCTCGECFGGWLSKRMRFRLRTQASLQSDNMSFPFIDFVRGQPLSSDDIYTDTSLQFIPRHLHGGIYKTFYFGYQSVFRAISDVLGVPSLCPTVFLVMSQIALFTGRATQFYYDKGGKVEHALDCVVYTAMEQSTYCNGDGTFEECWEDEDAVGTVYTGLTECQNDGEFFLVRKMLGLDPGGQWGPYHG